MKSLKPVDINFRELLLGDVNRLRYIRRYGTSLVNHPENVAEHSYYVCLYTWVIGTWVLECTSQEFSLGFALEKAVSHDIEEGRTGDLVRDFKYRDTALKERLDELGELEVFQIFKKVFRSKSRADMAASLWRNSKDHTPEGCVVAFSDYLAVLSYLWMELRHSNQSQAIHFETMKDYVEIFQETRFAFLGPLVKEVTKITEELINVRQKADKRKRK